MNQSHAKLQNSDSANEVLNSCKNVKKERRKK